MIVPETGDGWQAERASSGLTSLDLAEYIRTRGLQAEILRLNVETPTVEAAAAALGVTADQIIKSLVFEVGDHLVLVVAGGLTRVQSSRLATHLGVASSAVKLAAPERVAAATGYPVGGVPPFGHASPLATLVDASVLKHPWVWGGGGEAMVLLKVQPETIVEASRAEVVDLQSPLDRGLG
jgi:prolyl-tRNA editing enzyme YbaK/EbsC (Cys-tRNA(Pro) deacylase)